MAASDPSLRPILGYRFHPTDLELVTHYLEKKITGDYVSPSLIPTFNDMYTIDPLDLPIDKFKYGFPNEAYYFVLRKNIGSRGKRRTDIGTWKAVGLDKPITDGNGIEVGHMLQLSYHYNDHKGSSGWIMQEYRLGAKEHKKAQKTGQEWVLCRIKRPGGIKKSDRVGEFDHLVRKFEVGESSISAIIVADGHDLGARAPSPRQAVNYNDQDIPTGKAQAKEETKVAAAAVTGGPSTTNGTLEVETCDPKIVLPSSSYTGLAMEDIFTEKAPSSQDYIVPGITAASKESASDPSSGGEGLVPASSGDQFARGKILEHPFLSWDAPKVEFVEEEEEKVVAVCDTPDYIF